MTRFGIAERSEYGERQQDLTHEVVDSDYIFNEVSSLEMIHTLKSFDYIQS
jgi:hypothetical protein